MILFQNMKISVKLFIGFFIMILFMAGIGIGGYIGIKTIAHHSDDIFANRMPGVSYLLQTDRDLQQLLVAERSMIFANPKSSVFKSMVNAYEENLKQIEIRWEEYKSLDLSEKEKALIPRYEAAHREWKAISTQIVDGRKADTRKGRRLALDLTLGNALGIDHHPFAILPLEDGTHGALLGILGRDHLVGLGVKPQPAIHPHHIRGL